MVLLLPVKPGLAHATEAPLARAGESPRAMTTATHPRVDRPALAPPLLRWLDER